MSVREILLIPDKRLKQLCEPVSLISKEEFKLADDMFETMYDAPGIGLAAPQVGVMKNIIVMDCAKEEDEKPDPIIMINPKIIFFSQEKRIYEEGCLSIPEFFGDIERPENIKVRYQDIDGKNIEREADGLLATCIQHEVDHLEGKLFIDYLSRLKRERVVKKFSKMAKLREK
jgi:peptide deformylase